MRFVGENCPYYRFNVPNYFIVRSPDGTGLRLSVAPSWGRANATGSLLGDGVPRLGGSALSTLVPPGAGSAPALALASDLGLAYASPPTAGSAGQDLSLRLGYAPPATVRAVADYRLEVLWSRGF